METCDSATNLGREPRDLKQRCTGCKVMEVQGHEVQGHEVQGRASSRSWKFKVMKFKVMEDGGCSWRDYSGTFSGGGETRGPGPASPAPPSPNQRLSDGRVHCTGPGQVASGLPATPIGDSRAQTLRLETPPHTLVLTRAQCGKHCVFGTAVQLRTSSAPHHPGDVPETPRVRRGEALNRHGPAPRPHLPCARGQPGHSGRGDLATAPGAAPEVRTCMDHGHFPRGQEPRRPGPAGGAGRPAVHARPPAPAAQQPDRCAEEGHGGPPRPHFWKTHKRHRLMTQTGIS